MPSSKLHPNLFGPVGLAVCCLLIVSCGGGGGSSSSTNQAVASTGSDTSCGVNYSTPNYVLNHDPATGKPNLVLAWSGFPVNIYIASTVNRDFNGTTYSTDDAVRTGMNRWLAATGGKISYNFVTDPTKADITVTITNLDAEPGVGKVLGVTSLNYTTPDYHLTSASVVVYTWTGMTLDQFTKGFYATTTHELGHSMFLSGHSESSADLMYYQSNPDQDKLPTVADVNTMVTAYCGSFNTRSRAPQTAGRQAQTVTIIDRK